jgi:hypothetical protein
MSASIQGVDGLGVPAAIERRPVPRGTRHSAEPPGEAQGRSPASYPVAPREASS